jgi:hypothetical protein
MTQESPVTEERADRENQPSSTDHNSLLAVAALCVLVAGMWWSWDYPFPDGKHMDVWGFIQLWGRELLIVVFAAAVLLLILVLGLVRWLRARFSGSQ